MPKADKLSPGAVKLLKERQVALIATVMKDGSPQMTPVWVDADEDGSHVIINTRDDNLKTKNFDRDPRVAITVVDSENMWRLVTVHGTVVERTKDGAVDHINRMAKKYRGQDQYPFRSPDEAQKRTIVRIKPHHVVERGTE